MDLWLMAIPARDDGAPPRTNKAIHLAFAARDHIRTCGAKDAAAEEVPKMDRDEFDPYSARSVFGQSQEVWPLH